MGKVTQWTATSVYPSSETTVLIKNSGGDTSHLNTLDWFLKDLLSHDPVTRCGIRTGGAGARKTCNSLHRCVRCSVYRLTEVRSSLRKALAVAEDVAFVTLTQAHPSGEIKSEWDALEATLHQLTFNGTWSRFQKRHFITGYSITVEHTLTPQGWHPHAHMLLTFSQVVPPGALDALVAALTDRWVAAAAHVGNVASVKRQRVRMIPRDERNIIANYVTKQSLLYRSPDGGGQTPGDLLALAQQGDGDALRHFLEFVAAAFKKPLIRRYGSLSPTSD